MSAPTRPQPPSAPAVLRAELASWRDSPGPAVWVAAAMLASGLLLVGVRRAGQGTLTPSVTFDVLTMLLAAVLACAGVRLASRRQHGIELAQHLTGWSPEHRLLVCACDGLALAAGAALTILVGVPVGSGHRPASGWSGWLRWPPWWRWPWWCCGGPGPRSR